MKSHPGIRVYYGRWLIPGYPRVFLFDLHSMEHNLYQWRQELTGNFSRPDDTETNDAITFGNMVSSSLIVDHHPDQSDQQGWLGGKGGLSSRSLCSDQQKGCCSIP